MTRKLLSLLLVALFAGSFTVSAQKKGAQLTFNKTAHDFGTVKQNVPASYIFEVKNTGDAPLFITNVEAQCGCTTPEWTTTPIAPGKTGTVKATFNAASPGAFNKSIYVKSNASNVAQGERFELKIQGTVK